MSGYKASANREVEAHVERLRKARDVYLPGSPQWCIYDAAMLLALLLAQQQEDS